eukprot:m.188858 g.188858  ORF g.188858 m.188858 type:complete len:455 (+) comp10560_c0_seq1:511-1875(+)
MSRNLEAGQDSSVQDRHRQEGPNVEAYRREMLARAVARWRSQRRSNSENQNDNDTDDEIANPDFEHNNHTGVVNAMIAMDDAMEYMGLFRVWKRFWRTAGRAYNLLDIWGGICFVLGGLSFTLGPWLEKDGYVSSSTADYILIVGVIFYILAKLFVEIRAIYATLWQRPHMRPGAVFHFSITTLMLAGLFFLTALILSLESLPIASGWSNFTSCLFFLTGNFSFLMDSAALFKRPFSHLGNTYFFNALSLFLGSVFFQLAACCNISIVRHYSAPPGQEFADVALCTTDFTEWNNTLGGLFYLLGGIFSLIFALHEYAEALLGPDPRCINRYGGRNPHPYRPHEGTAREHEDEGPDHERFPSHREYMCRKKIYDEDRERRHKLNGGSSGSSFVVNFSDITETEQQQLCSAAQSSASIPLASPMTEETENEHQGPITGLATAPSTVVECDRVVTSL